MRFLVFLCIFLSIGAAFAQGSSKIDLGAGVSSYQKFLIYPHIDRGLKALDQGDSQRAIQEFLRAREIAPKSPATALYLANAYVKENDYSLAIEVLEKQIRITPKDAQVLKRLSNTLVQEKDYLAASASLSEELKVNANNAIALEKLKVVNQELQNEELKRLKTLQVEDPAQFLADIKDKKISFDNVFDERSWIDLLLTNFSEQSGLLLDYQPVFESNKIYQAEKILQNFLVLGLQSRADAYIQQLPDSIKLNPVFLDHLSYQLTNENGEHQAIELLLEAYPFKRASHSQQIELINRLILLLKNHPDNMPVAYVGKLITPLDTPELRTLQVKLLSALNDCTGIRTILGDYSAFYTSSDWTSLGYCYGDNVPGMGEFAFERADELAPNPDHERAIAYQAFKTKNYTRALTAWNSIPLKQMTPDDILSAAITAQTAGDARELRKWISIYEQRNGKKNDRYWWLVAQLNIQSNPSKALNDLMRAAAIQPSVTYYSQIATLLMAEDKLDDAISYLHQALTLNPYDSGTQALLGYTYYKKGNYKSSRYYLQAALKSRPDDEELVKQLAYTNQKLGNNTQAIQYAKEAIDNFGDIARLKITPEMNSQEFGMRRMHEDLERRWSFTADAMSGNQVTAAPNIGQPGVNYRSYSQAEAAYRLGNPAIDNGKTLSAYTRIFAGGGVNNSPLPIYAPMIAGGLRWKPFSDYVLNLAVEEQVPLDKGQYTQTSAMLRASASFLNSGRYSDDWHPNGSGWVAQNLYLDAAHYLATSVTSLVADYRLSYHQKIEEGQTIEPYAHLQWTSLNQSNGIDERLGIGARWNIWQGQSKYNAYPSKILIGLEYQYAFKTYLTDKSAVFLSLGGRW